MQKKTKKDNLIKQLFPIILFLLFVIIVITIFVQHQKGNIESRSSSTNDTTKTEIEIPLPEIEVERKSKVCSLNSPEELPLNWPSDLPVLDNTISIQSNCFSDNPSSFQTQIVVQEAYSYLTFALIQDIKILGWEFTTETPDLNPKSDSLSLEAKKDGRKLILQITKSEDINKKPATVLIFIEKY